MIEGWDNGDLSLENSKESSEMRCGGQNILDGYK